MTKRKEHNTELNYDTLFDYKNLYDPSCDYEKVHLTTNYYITALELYNNKKYKESIEFLEKILKLNSTSIIAYKLYLKIYIIFNDLKNIEITLKKLIELKPNDWFFYYNLALLYISKLHDNENGILILLEGLKINSNKKEIYNLLIYIYIQNDNIFDIIKLHEIYNYSNSKKIINQIINSCNQIEFDIKCFLNININIKDNNDLLIVKNIYLDFLLKNPNDKTILFLIAKYYNNTFNNDKCIFYAELSTNIDDKYIEPKYLLLDQYHKKNNIEKLKNICLDIISINYSYTLAHYYLASLYYNNNEYSDAIYECNIILKEDKYNIQTLFLLGNIFEKQKLIKEAVDIYNLILKIEPNNNIVLNAIIKLI